MTTQPISLKLPRPRFPAFAFPAITTAALLAGLCAGSAAWAKGTDTMEEQLYVSTDYTHPEEFTFGIEGPACDAQGNLYAVNYARQGTIGKVTPQGELSVFVELPSGSIGNGIRFDSHGAMLIADYTGHNVLKVDMQTRQVSVYAHEEAMNQPNDLAISANDVVYASDPNWSKGTGQLWRINLDGTATLLDGAMGTTNGIEVSPDERTLYVNESVQRKVWAFDLSETGDISNKRLLIEFPDFGLDGMRCDVEGNLYITRYGKGTVAKVSPGGELLLEVALTGRNPSNIAFGGPDGRTCYVTLADRGCIETFRVEAPGRSWQLFEERKVPVQGDTWGRIKGARR
jgi:sugar lactone lactonase YvrE